MSRLTISGILACVLLFVVPTFVAAEPPAGITGNVTVMNQSSNPVPVTGSLAVSGTANVNVVNTAPLPVTVDAAQQPFQITLCTIGWPPGCLSTPSQFAIPTGKRLVIEYISGQCDTGPTADFLALIEVATIVGGGVVYHHVVPQFLGSASTTKLYGAAQQTRIYADPGTTVYANASGVPTGDVGCLLSFSGYLVNP